ncbi:MAG: T9SS type B sorting domain-containing protein [Bacteroidales bacterium]
MKKILVLYVIFLLLALSKINAQTNLVPNGDFEIYSSLPTDYGQCNRAVGWNNVNGNYSGVTASPDYYNLLSSNGSLMSYIGAIIAISGNGQMGLDLYDTYSIDSNYREYISTQLLSSMLNGHLYKVSFYLTNGVDTFGTLSCNNFGIHFSVLPLTQHTREPITVEPQIEIDTIVYFWNYWQHFSFNYIADSSYKYITIGNFRNDAHTLISLTGKNDAYYFIDKIDIIPVLNIIGDTIICKGDTTSLTATADSIVQWANTLNPDSILSTNTTIKVNPAITNTYLAYGVSDTASFTVNVVDKPIINLGPDTILCNGYSMVLDATQNNATYLWHDNSVNSDFSVKQQGMYWVTVETYKHCSASDTVIVSYTSCEIPELWIPKSFTPNGDGLNDKFEYGNAENYEIKTYIYNRWGQMIFEGENTDYWDGSYKEKPVQMDVYNYKIEAIDKASNEKKVYNGRVTIVK